MLTVTVFQQFPRSTTVPLSRSLYALRWTIAYLKPLLSFLIATGHILQDSKKVITVFAIFLRRCISFSPRSSRLSPRIPRDILKRCSCWRGRAKRPFESVTAKNSDFRHDFPVPVPNCILELVLHRCNNTFPTLLNLITCKFQIQRKLSRPDRSNQCVRYLKLKSLRLQ